ncbi:MAG TPA: endonuclease III [Candidatus Bathyarchaeia archaeon]|nr:endonuclease III [Candidatus Bathyarchaeia archaeon]
MTENRAAAVLQILRQTLPVPTWSKSKRDPFETLVVTIISQNTADRNTARAFENLSKRFEITPEVLANAETSQIEESLKVAGLYKNKAKTIKQVSRIIIEKFHGTLEPILSLPLEDARKTLMQFPGVGPKTADVVLLFSAKQPTIPVDTHVNRVTKRLGLAPVNGDYETVRKSLQLLYNPSDYLAVHILLIAHGRKHCKAIRPLCEPCPVNMHCPSKGVIRGFIKL